MIYYIYIYIKKVILLSIIFFFSLTIFLLKKNNFNNAKFYKTRLI